MSETRKLAAILAADVVGYSRLVTWAEWRKMRSVRSAAAHGPRAPSGEKHSSRGGEAPGTVTAER
jgi:hypothetical protein